MCEARCSQALCQTFLFCAVVPSNEPVQVCIRLWSLHRDGAYFNSVICISCQLEFSQHSMNILPVESSNKDRRKTDPKSHLYLFKLMDATCIPYFCYCHKVEANSCLISSRRVTCRLMQFETFPSHVCVCVCVWPCVYTCMSACGWVCVDLPRGEVSVKSVLFSPVGWICSLQICTACYCNRSHRCCSRCSRLQRRVRTEPEGTAPPPFPFCHFQSSAVSWASCHPSFSAAHSSWPLCAKARAPDFLWFFFYLSCNCSLPLPHFQLPPFHFREELFGYWVFSILPVFLRAVQVRYLTSLSTVHPWLCLDCSLYCLSLIVLLSSSYGRVYTADPYHALAPAASYGVGAVVSSYTFYLNCFSPSDVYLQTVKDLGK